MPTRSTNGNAAAIASLQARTFARSVLSGVQDSQSPDTRDRDGGEKENKILLAQQSDIVAQASIEETRLIPSNPWVQPMFAQQGQSGWAL
ncbi:hypothetical protein DL765_005552 [Monosporascus sp. GIB2]|nr:hypothetical protein DL765_005552 [Monosporascus sp. GIB2]